MSDGINVASVFARMRGLISHLTLEIPLLRGRLFNEQDGPDKEKVIVVTNEFAAHFFPGQDPIGKQIHDVNSIGLSE